jgi:alpha-D-ribose 1-methylphosphonate 5-triphosphate synthase subunit PhnH
MTDLTLSHFWPALPDPVLDGQKLFRQLLNALSQPGTVHELHGPVPPQAGMGSALWGGLLALCDLEINVWIAPEMDSSGLRSSLKFHSGCRFCDDPEDADFAVLDAAAPLYIDAFRRGDPKNPERSTTLFIRVEQLVTDRGWHLSGPGIPEQRRLDIGASHPDLLAALRANRPTFPCGLDVFFVCGERLVGVPRSTRIEEVH